MLAARGAIAMLALVAVISVINLSGRPMQTAVVLSEDKALALAEGKISDSQRQSIASGGMGATKKMAQKRDHLRRLVADAEQKEAMVTLQAWKLQRAQDALHQQLSHSTKLRRMLDGSDGMTAPMTGGDSLVSVNKIRTEEAARPAPILRRDAKNQHFLSNIFHQAAIPAVGRKVVAQPQTKEERERVQAFLDSNGDLGSARKVVAQRHVGDNLIAGGDDRIDAGRADSHARQAGVGAFFDVFGESGAVQRSHATLKHKGVNLDSEPWQTKGGKLF